MTANLKRVGVCALAALVLTAWLAPAVRAVPKPDDPPKPDSAAEKIRKALDLNISVDFDEGHTVNTAIDFIRAETKINIVIDRTTTINLGIDPASSPVQLKLKNVKVKSVLKNLLSQYSLTYVIEQDILLVTTEDNAIQRQIRQRVSIDVEKATLEDAIKYLVKETGVNLVLDPRHAKKATDTVTLKLEDVPLEVAVRLLAEMAGLRSVRQSNVLFVTSKEVAAELKKEEEQPVVPNPFGPYMEKPWVVPGIGLPAFGGAAGLVPPAPPVADPADIKREDRKPEDAPKKENVERDTPPKDAPR